MDPEEKWLSRIRPEGRFALTILIAGAGIIASWAVQNYKVGELERAQVAAESRMDRIDKHVNQNDTADNIQTGRIIVLETRQMRAIEDIEDIKRQERRNHQ